MNFWSYYEQIQKCKHCWKVIGIQMFYNMMKKLYLHVVHEDHLFQISFCTCVPKVRKLSFPFFKVFFLCRWFYFESFKVKWYINEHKGLWLVFRTNSGTYRRQWKGKKFYPNISINKRQLYQIRRDGRVVSCI